MNTIQELPDDQVFAELRRRGVSQNAVMGAMGWQYVYVPPRPAAESERRIALISLALLGAALVGLIGFLAIQGKEPPGLLSALAGTCIGALAGLLAPKPTQAVGHARQVEAE